MRSASNPSSSFVVLKTDVIALPSNLSSRTERTTCSDQRPPRTHQYHQSIHRSSSNTSFFKQTTHLLLGRVKTNLTQGPAVRCKVGNGKHDASPKTPPAPEERRLPVDLPTPIFMPFSSCYSVGLSHARSAVPVWARRIDQEIGSAAVVVDLTPNSHPSSPSHLVPAQISLFFATFQGYYDSQSDADELPPGLALRARPSKGTPGALDFVFATRRSLPDHQRGGVQPAHFKSQNPSSHSVRALSWPRDHLTRNEVQPGTLCSLSYR